MDEDQAMLFEERIESLYENYTLENAIALMNDFPIDARDEIGFTLLL